MAGTSVANALGSYAIHTAIDSALGPIATKVYYTANAADPVSVPSVEALVEAKLRGWINPGLANALAIVQGVDLGGEQLPGNIVLNPNFEAMVAAGWSDVIRSRQTTLSIPDALELWVRQDITGDQLETALIHNGVIDPDARLRLQILESKVPEVNDVLPAYLRGLLSRTDASQLLSRRGYALDRFEPLLAAQSGTVPPEKAIEYGLRLEASGAETTQLLVRAGVFDPAEQAKFLTLYQKLPNRSDVNLWLQRNVFDQQYVTDFRLDEGFQERFWARFSTILEAGGWSRDYAYLDYAAHWIVPAVGQLAEMVQRLRPGRVDANLTYTREDFNRTLAEQDYAPYYRDRLLAISYRPLPIRFLRAAFQTDNLTVEGVAEAYQDQGYSAETAAFMAQTERTIKARARAQAARGWTPQAIARSFVAGQMSADQASALMTALGFTVDETRVMLDRATLDFNSALTLASVRRSLQASSQAVLRAYGAGTASAGAAQQSLQNAGWQPAAATAMLAAVDLNQKTATAQKVFMAVRRAFLRGNVTLAQAQSILLDAGIEGARVLQQTAVWELELTPARKHASAGAIRKGVLTGLLSTDQARAALTNLGYADPDAALLAAEMANDMASHQVQLQKAFDKSAVSAARLYEQLLAKNASIKGKIHAALKRATPPAKLQQWLVKGFIDDDDFIHRMSQMGYDDDTTLRYLEEAHARRASKAAGSAGAATGQGETNGAAAQ